MTASSKITIRDFQSMKDDGEKITMISAYTFPIAKIIDKIGIDSILVGDSLGMTILGYENTLEVTIEDAIRHSQAVSRGVNRALIIGDMPFLSYGIKDKETVRNAGRLIQEGKCEAVKLEGGRERIEEIKEIKAIGIPVLGHIGLTPTYVNEFGGFKVQGKSVDAEKRLIEDAKMLEDAGAFAIVIESVPWKLGKIISQSISIPTIGIGAGQFCDGQVLVIDDIIGLTTSIKPKFVKQYADVTEVISKAVKDYKTEVKELRYPSDQYRYDD
ncbi:MAG: 3-methyl-2-oxobutanoate hydroxymethyltransferase [Candidatus Heimdallarchaeota archaeon]|nr:3-methyl-2-oxobutanoate hydroxymethyltransferase [Candidatus Heimdallarchaeota archaeon]